VEGLERAAAAEAVARWTSSFHMARSSFHMACQDKIEAHKVCLRGMGFKV